MTYFDDSGEYVGPRSTSKAAERAALRMYQQGLKDQEADADAFDVQPALQRLVREVIEPSLAYHAGLLQISKINQTIRQEIFMPPDWPRLLRMMMTTVGAEPPPRDQPAETVTRAYGISDISGAIGNMLYAQVIHGFNAAPEIWPKIAEYLPLPDFKESTILRGLSIAAPPTVKENGEINYAVMRDEGEESVRIETHAHRVSLSRQVQINGALEAMRIAYQAGLACNRGIGASVASLLVNNPQLSDGTAVFDASRGNVATASAPSTSAVDAMFSSMGGQQNAAGEYLNYKPRFILAGPGYASTLAMLRGAMNQGNDSGQSDGDIATLIDSRIPGTNWFGIADTMHGGIYVAVLAGTEGKPRFERVKTPVNRDGIDFVAGYDYAIACGNPKALAWNSGV